MDTDTVTPTEPVWGTPPAEPAHWSTKKTLAAVGIAVVLAGAGAAVIYAAAGSGNSRGGPGGFPGFPGGFPEGFQGFPGGAGPPGGPGFGAGRGGPGGMADALHAQFVVADEHGGFRTQLTQTGTVTDISSTAVTARSADGFIATYAINAGTRQAPNPIKVGDPATITAVQQDGANTATAVSPGS